MSSLQCEVRVLPPFFIAPSFAAACPSALQAFNSSHYQLRELRLSVMPESDVTYMQWDAARVCAQWVYNT
jgi:hypothetical protein